MDEFLKDLARFGDLTEMFTPLEVALVLGLSFVLNLAVAWTYKFTHRGISYSQSFAHTLVILGVTVGLIMLIIGSNIARAFALVGALSVVRFRNAVKESRDVAFVFFAMAIGMACGTRFYALAVFSTLAVSAFVVALSKLNLFAREFRERILRAEFPAGADPDALLAPVFERFAEDAALVSVETVKAGEVQEAVYSVRLRPKAEEPALIEEVRKLTGGRRVTLVTGFQEIDL
jgi:protein-S-isoprenylcysteine O-methyltransferase Ste14